jgi:hypothetical protein
VLVPLIVQVGEAAPAGIAGDWAGEVKLLHHVAAGVVFFFGRRSARATAVQGV